MLNDCLARYTTPPPDLIVRDKLWWDQFFLELAEKFASASKDPSTKVGAILVDPDRVVVGSGFNGFPQGVNDTVSRYTDRPTKYKLVMHAETNAVVNSRGLAKGATLYVYPSFGAPPICTECAKVVIQAGVREVVGYEIRPEDEAVVSRWAESIDVSRMMCDEAGVKYRLVPRRQN